MKKLFDNSKQFCLVAGCFLMLCLVAVAPQRALGQAPQVTITPNENPVVVPMGDSLVFKPALYLSSSGSITNGELEVTVPPGFEFLTSTPSYKPLSLSSDKRTARIIIPTLSFGVSLPLQIYVKALCDAETATAQGSRFITYKFYAPGNPTPATKSTDVLVSFRYPVLNVTYPGSAIVAIKGTNQRTFTFKQTYGGAHLSNMEVLATCDTSGFYITAVEVSHKGDNWVSIPVVKTPTGYRYILKRNQVFTVANDYPDKHLSYNDSVKIRETVSLRKCGAGTVTYAFNYGDGTTFCSGLSYNSNDITYSVENFVYTPDVRINTTANTHYYTPKTPTDTGYWTYSIQNKSTNESAVLEDAYLNHISSASQPHRVIWLRTYFVTSAGNIDLGPDGDTVFINLQKTNVYDAIARFDSLKNTDNPTWQAWYRARGLDCMDGDNKFNDIKRNSTVWLRSEYKYGTILQNTSCYKGDEYFPNYIMIDLYYRTFCKETTYTMFPRYNFNGVGTHRRMGGLTSASVDNIAITPVSNLHANDEETMVRFRLEWDPSEPNIFRGEFGAAMISGIQNGNSTLKTVIVLPVGLAFQPSPSTVNSFRIGSYTFGTGSNATYTHIPGNSLTSDTLIISWPANSTHSAGTHAGVWSIPVKSNGNADEQKTLQVYYLLDFGNIGTFARWACNNFYVPYTQILSCDPLEMTSFTVERRSFGYTDIYKTKRVTHVDSAKKYGFNLGYVFNRDDVAFIGSIQANNNFATVSTNALWVEVNYAYSNSNSLFQPVTDGVGVNIYHNNSTIPITVPASNIVITYTAENLVRHYRVNIMPALAAANINGINAITAGDLLRIEVMMRATNSLPSAPAYILMPEMRIETTVSGTPNVCSPMNAELKIWHQGFDRTGGGSWGMNACRSTYYQNATSDLPLTHFVTDGNTTNYNTWEWVTGGEYRPNMEHPRLTSRIKGLYKIHQVRQSINGAGYGTQGTVGTWVTRTLDSAADYRVYWEAGYTYINIYDKGTDAMFLRSNVGYTWQITTTMINAPANGFEEWVMYGGTNMPTSAAPTQDTLTAWNGSSWGCDVANTYVYGYTFVPVQANVNPSGQQVEWNLTLTNTSTWANSDPVLKNSWIGIECPPNVYPVQIYDVGTSTNYTDFLWYDDNKYWIKLGDLTASPAKTLTLTCNYSVCNNLQRLKVIYGQSPVDYPANPYGYANYGSPGYIQQTKSADIYFTPPRVNFSASLQHFPNMENGKNRFCDSVRFEGVYTNALSPEILNLRLQITLPDGFQYYSAYQPKVKFGNGSWEDAQEASVTNGVLTIKLDDTQTVKANGTAANADKAYVRFALRMVCGVENGQQLRANFIGESGCGSSTTVSTVTDKQIRIGGLQAPPEYFINNLSLTQNPLTGGANGDGTMTLTGEYKIGGNPPVAETYGIIDLPENLEMISSQGLSFAQDGRRLTTTTSFPDDATVQPGDEYPFEITLRPINIATWNGDSLPIYVSTGLVNQLTCAGRICFVLELGEQDSVFLTMEKLQVCFRDSIRSSSSYNDPNSERVTVEGWLINSGEYDAGRLTMDWCYYDGTDYIPINDVISSLTVNNILKDDTVFFQVTANVRYTERLCDMYLLLRKHNTINGARNPYLQDSCIIKIPVPPYNISEVVDPICPMQGNVTIGELPIKDYQYKWTPSTYLSQDNKTQTLFNYDWQNDPVYTDQELRYFVDITRPSGCTSRDTIFVPVKGLPFVSQPSNLVRCAGDDCLVTFTDPNNASTSFSWSCDGGLSAGFPLSGNSSSINIAAVHNMGTQPIVVTIRVTPKRDGCEGETKYFFVTVNPAPRTYSIPDQVNCAGATVPAINISGNLVDATYHWKLNTGTNVVGGSSSGTALIPSYIAQNSGTTILTGSYEAWSVYEYGGTECASDKETFDISIEPMPTVTVTGATNLCNGDNLALSFSGTPTDNIYQYQKISGGNIGSLPAIGTGTGMSESNVQNLTGSPITALYSITPVSVSGRCMGAQQNITINIYPTPLISGLKSFTQCSGERFSYTLSSVVNGVGFTWEGNLIEN